MFLSLDGTFWFQLVNFAIFFAVLNVVFLRPVGEAIKKRRAYIDGVQADYERYQAQVKALRGEADQKRSAARRAADETIARARAEGEAEAGSIGTARTADAQAIAEAHRATVAAEVAAAKTREGELTQSLSRSLLDRVLGGTG